MLFDRESFGKDKRDNMKKTLICGFILCLAVGGAYAHGKSSTASENETVVFKHQNSPRLSPGDRVYVTGSEFKSQYGTITGIKLDENAYEVQLESGTRAIIRKNFLAKMGENNVYEPAYAEEYVTFKPNPDQTSTVAVETPPQDQVEVKVTEQSPAVHNSAVSNSAASIPALSNPAPQPAQPPVIQAETHPAAPAQAPQPVAQAAPPVLPAEKQPAANNVNAKKRLAILPVICVEDYTAETLAWHIANQNVVYDNFDIVPITPNIKKNVLKEQSYSSIFSAGEDLSADYVLASFTRKVGFQKVFFMVVLDVESRQQLAGAYKLYNDVEEAQSYFPVMTKRIMSVLKNTNHSAPKLSVKLMDFPSYGINKSDAAILTQLLAIEMANTNVYRVFPRTDNIDAALYEYESQRSTAKRIYWNSNNQDLVPVDYVLNSKVSFLPTTNEIVAEIVSLETNVLVNGTHINFDVIDEVPSYLSRLAQLLVNKRARPTP